MAIRRRARAALVAGACTAAFVAGRSGRRAGPGPREELERDTKDRFDLAKLSYDEVLDATKHQDDKVGRFLAAVSFLTAASIAFGTRADVLDVRYDIDGRLPLPGVLFAGFFAIVVVAIVFLLMALGQPLGPPGSPPNTAATSHLFFLLISDATEGQWKKLWGTERTPADIRAGVTDNLVAEAHNLATRATKKYRRTSEAQALFTVALLCFGLAIALAINVLARQAKDPVPWDLRSRLVAMFILTSFAAALGYGWVRLKQKLAGPRTWPLYWAWWLGMIYPGAVLVPPLVLPIPVGAALASAVGLGLVVCWSRPSVSGSARWVMAALVIALAVSTPIATAAEAERWRLGLACASVALFEVPRLLSASFRSAAGAERRPR